MVSLSKIRRNMGLPAYAFCFWTIWGFINCLKDYQYNGGHGSPFVVFVVSTIFGYYLFALLTIPSWFICKKVPCGEYPLILFALFHTFLAFIVSILWIFLIMGSGYLSIGTAIFERVDLRKLGVGLLIFAMTQYAMVLGTYYTIIYYRSFKQKEMSEAELRLLSRDAELKALKLQLNPHFLFNSLNSISALVTTNAPLARKMIARLSDVLRMTLDSHDRQMAPLRYELDFARAYLDIELIRFGDRMDYQQEVDPSLLNKWVPVMLLQPLMENAVKHGIANRLAGGTVRLSIRPSAENMIIEVSNQLNDDQHIDSRMLFHNGTGLSNLRKRLDRLYEEAYRVDIDTGRKGEFVVSLVLPHAWETSGYVDEGHYHR